MISSEMKYDLNFSQKNPTYIIRRKPPKDWFFKKQGFPYEIKNNKSKDYLIQYAIAHCRTICSKLIIYSSYGSVQEVLSFNYSNTLEE